MPARRGRRTATGTLEARARKLGINTAELVDYDELREAFIAEQKRRLEQMGLHLTTQDTTKKFVFDPPVSLTLRKGGKDNVILAVSVYGVNPPTDTSLTYNVLFNYTEGGHSLRNWREADVFIANATPTTS